MSCILSTNCIKHYINSVHIYQKSGVPKLKDGYFGFFFKACYLKDPMHFFWGNPYAPIWLLGKNPAGNPTTIIMDQRWELLLKNWSHLSSINHFKKYKEIVKGIFPSTLLQNTLIGFGDAVKCYSTSFQANKWNKSIYKECLISHTLRLYQETKPYVIVFRGGIDFQSEIELSFKEKLGINLSTLKKNCKELIYYLLYNIPLLIILTPFDITPYSNIIVGMILSFFWNLKHNKNEENICNSSQNIIDFESSNLSSLDCKKKLLDGSEPKEIKHYKEIEKFYDCINQCIGPSTTVDICAKSCLNLLNPLCNQYCDGKDDSKECEEEILKYYKKVREEFDNFIGIKVS